MHGIYSHLSKSISDIIEKREKINILRYLPSPLEIEVGSIIYFYDADHTEVITAVDEFEDEFARKIEHWYHLIKFFDGEVDRVIPIYQLHHHNEDNCLHTGDIFSEANRIKKFLGKPWKIEKTEIQISNEFEIQPSNKPFFVYDLIECDDQTIVKWYLEQEDMMMKQEINEAISSITKKYAEIRKQHTTYEDTVIRHYIENEKEHSRFKWGEGTEYWTSWTNVWVSKRKEYYKGLFVKEYEIEKRENDNDK